MTQQDYLNTSTSILRKWYAHEHSNCSIEAVYLWGSLLRNDFDPSSSDIDAIAITAQNTSENVQHETRLFLAKQIPGFTNFKINTIHISELNGGTIRSPLTQVLPPQLLLFEFNEWLHIAGKKFQRSNFKLPQLSLQQAIGLEFEQIDQRFILEIEHKNYASIDFMRKCVSAICHFSQELTYGEHRFSYDSLNKYKDTSTGELVDIILGGALQQDKVIYFKNQLPRVIIGLERLRKLAEMDGRLTRNSQPLM